MCVAGGGERGGDEGWCLKRKSLSVFGLCTHVIVTTSLPGMATVPCDPHSVITVDFPRTNYLSF